MKPVFLFIISLSLTHSFLNVFKRSFLKSNELSLSRDDYYKERMKKYPYSKLYYENAIKRLNSKNKTIQNESILDLYNEPYESHRDNELNNTDPFHNMGGGFRIIITNNGLGIGFDQSEEDNDDDYNEDDQYEQQRKMSERRRGYSEKKNKKSENFEVIENTNVDFSNIGGYDLIKEELNQCIDLLKNGEKYEKYDIRIPKGLLFEGPPGNGKTLIAKALAGEAKTGFIAVSGSEFQEKYVGVGASRIRELFDLAKKNKPCIIFIDEIDAVGRKRSSDGELSSSERDNTLNELLVSMDGFKNTSGVFVIGATNRADLLDSALTRPGRIDKRIFIGLPDSKTREAILKINMEKKVHDTSILFTDLIEQTNGLSCAQIENLINEAMLNALRNDREKFSNTDLEIVLNKMLVGWQPNEHQFTNDIIDHIAIHEMGHVVVGMLSNNHANITKVIINLSAPNSPAYTVFESSVSSILTREALFEHLMILLAGRIAEEVAYGVSVTTGAINDFEEALKLAEKMILYYGMGKQIIYPRMSDKYKQMVDEEVAGLINDAYGCAEFIVRNSKDFVLEGASILKKEKTIRIDGLLELMNNNHRNLLNLRFQ